MAIRVVYNTLVSCSLISVISVSLLASLTVVCATNATAPVPQTDEEIEQEFHGWIARMQDLRLPEKVDGLVLNELDLATASATASVSYTVRTIVVDIKGKGDYKSIAKALKAIPNGNRGRTVISVGPGTYIEHLTIKKDQGPITLQGSGIRRTIVTWNLDSTKAGGTLKSASVSVESDNFIAKDISFQNTSPSPPAGAVGKQAVAFEISGDKAAFYRVGFLGYQDTLYDRYGRHYFKDCYIRGSIDYIFGDGQSFYETCYLESVATSFGSLVAQKRISSAEDTGYVFSDCTVKGTGYIYLSRAWGPYSRVVFMRTYFDNIIRPEGWYNWGVFGREKTVFYGEYKCYGPGANRQGRERWSYELTDAQVQPFATKEQWLGNWIPKAKQ